jgi:rhamnosyltransferase
MVRRRRGVRAKPGRIPRVPAPRISVIIRARDEERSIGRCLELIAAQETGDMGVETIVVDSGSRDRTGAIAREAGASLLRVAPSAFSFGGALNLGAATARGAILVALSADAFLPDPGWLGRLAGILEDSVVACASASRHLPDGAVLEHRIVLDADAVSGSPGWGYSNAAGGFRAELWRQRPFREDLPGCEDLEWAAYWLQRGHLCVIDPGLLVDHDHTHDPVLRIFERARREARGIAMFAPPPPYGLRALAHDWWSDLRFYESAWKARLSHRRAAWLLGTYAGRRGR